MLPPSRMLPRHLSPPAPTTSLAWLAACALILAAACSSAPAPAPTPANEAPAPAARLASAPGPRTPSERSRLEHASAAVGAPVYLAREVTVRAKAVGSESLHLTSEESRDLRREGECPFVELEFVVDTAGRVDARTVRVVRSTSSGLERALTSSIRRRRYRPAEFNGARVPQLTDYRTSFGGSACPK